MKLRIGNQAVLKAQRIKENDAKDEESLIKVQNQVQLTVTLKLFPDLNRG
jgi:hypothetical protein